MLKKVIVFFSILVNSNSWSADQGREGGWGSVKQVINLSVIASQDENDDAVNLRIDAVPIGLVEYIVGHRSHK